MDAAEELRYLILAVQREGNRRLNDALEPLGLTPSQAEVISVLAQYPPMTLLQLGERLVCEAGSPSRLVKTMVEAGWILKEANPQDGRAVLLRLSPRGAAIVPRLRAVEAAFHESIAAQADPETLRAAIDGLWRFAAGSASGEALRRRRAGS